jgi:hypothetical protein
MTDDIDDGTVAQGDTWLSGAVPTLLDSTAFTTQRSLLFIVWDENDDSPATKSPRSSSRTESQEASSRKSPTPTTACSARSRPPEA